MQIVIDIDEGIMQGIIEGKGDKPRDIVRSFQATIAGAIKNGTPLPKGHGRLIDADAVLSDPFGDTYKDIEVAETIIEADKSESEE